MFISLLKRKEKKSKFIFLPKNVPPNILRSALCHRILTKIQKKVPISKISTVHKKKSENSDFQDFEDCLQAECAESFDADYIITRNTKDFAKSPIPALTPEKFLKAYL